MRVVLYFIFTLCVCICANKYIGTLGLPIWLKVVFAVGIGIMLGNMLAYYVIGSKEFQGQKTNNYLWRERLASLNPDAFMVVVGSFLSL